MPLAKYDAYEVEGVIEVSNGRSSERVYVPESKAKFFGVLKREPVPAGSFLTRIADFSRLEDAKQYAHFRAKTDMFGVQHEHSANT